MSKDEARYITEDMIKGISSDIDFFRTVSSCKIQCENEAVYDKLMDWYGQLHIGACSNRETLIIIA